MVEEAGLESQNDRDCCERGHVAVYGMADYQVSLLPSERRIEVVALDLAQTESCDDGVTFSEAELSDGMRSGRRSLKWSRYVEAVNTRKVCRSGKGGGRGSAEPHRFC